MNLSSRKSSGFTLIELLVVLSIIALLIALLLPTLQNAREAARTTVCLSNQRQIGVAMFSYANEYDGTLRPGFWNSGGVSEWYRSLQPNYLSGPDNRIMTEVFACPSAENAMSHIGDRWDLNLSVAFHTTNGRYWPSYIPAQVSVGRKTGPPPSQHYLVTLDELPPGRAMFFERADFKPGNSAVDGPEEQSDLREFVSPLAYIELTNPARPPMLETRHGGLTSQNILFADGHVEQTAGQQITSAFYDGVASSGNRRRQWLSIVDNVGR